MTTQRSYKNRPIAWEEDAPADTRYRRVQQVAPISGRNLPGMPLEMPDPEDDDLPRARRRNYDAPSGPWWRPSSTWGRVLLGVGALLVVGSVFAAIYMFKTYLERDSRFRIAGAGSIEAAGLSEVTRAEMLPVFGEDIGRNVFFVPLNQRRKELEKIAWVEHATVMRLLPDQIRVTVVERRPVAFVRQGSQVGLVDGNGVLLTMSPSSMTKHHYSFPVVTGVDSGDPLAGRKARMAVYQRLLAELDSSGQHLSQQISEIDLTDPEDARVIMPEQGADILAHFGDDKFLERYQRYKSHIGEWRSQYPHLAAVDLRYDQQVVLEMAKGFQNQQSVNAGEGKPAVAPAATTHTKPAAGTRASSNAPAVSKAPAKKAPAKTKPLKSSKAKHTAPAKKPASKTHSTMQQGQ